MALIRTTNAPNTTYRFTYIAPTAIIDRKADQAAHWFFDQGDGDHGTTAKPRTYADLIMAEKLAILDRRVLRLILDASANYHVQVDQQAAIDAAYAEEESEVVT